MHRIAASILSAGRPQLPDAVRRLAAAGIDAVHLNVVQADDRPNFDLAHLACASIRAGCALPLHVQLRVPASDGLVETLAEAGADLLIVQPVAGHDMPALLARIRAAGCRAGLALGPAGHDAALADLPGWLPALDMVHVACADGLSPARSFLPAALAQVQRVRALLGAPGGPVRLQVDGHISAANAGLVAAAGADDVVVGRALFGGRDWAGTVAGLRAALDGAPADLPALDPTQVHA